MKYKFKYPLILLLIVSSLTISSCSDWLDVKPSNETSAGDLFSSERGFQEALTGVYTLMTKPALYGKEMTYGFVDVIAQQWSLSSANANNSPAYFFANRYDYENEATYSLIESMWAAQYNAIANINDILSFADKNKDVFQSEDTYSWIKGEALALRAYLHFDLLRLFAPNDFVVGSDKKSIPYVTELSKNMSASLTGKEFSDKCVADLMEAIKLLEKDPIVTNVIHSDSYFKNRTVHMNYFAAKALLARIYLYANKPLEALKEAKDVIAAQDATRFRWVTTDEATAGNEVNMNYTYSSEHVFSLNVTKLDQYIETSFGVESGSALLNKKYNKSDSRLFADEPNDFRTRLYITWNGYEKQFGKYKQVGKGIKLIPMIKISEMYYIVAECANSTERLDALKNVRLHRGLTQDILLDNIDQEIYKEYQKEFTGEGQLFYFYKRKNIVAESASTNYEPVLPLPRIEIDLGSRN